MDNKTNEICFNRIRDLYKELRIIERDKIIDFLKGVKEPKFVVTEAKPYQGCKGCDNWLGIDVKVEKNGREKAFFISLQPFGKDSKNKNVYVVMDRIGIYKYSNSNGKLETTNALDKMKDTYDITLPMNNKKLEKLVEYLKYLK